MFSYKIHAVGSLRVHSPYLYDKARKEFVDAIFDNLKNDGVSKQEHLIEITKNKYAIEFGKDKYYFQLDELLKRKLARRKQREIDIKDGAFKDLFIKSANLFKVRTEEGRAEQHSFIKRGILDAFFAEFYTQDFDDLLPACECCKQTKDYRLDNICGACYKCQNKGLDCEDCGLDKLDIYIKQNVKREVRNIRSRLRLALRKAELNKFNYFVTFTYDNKLYLPADVIAQIKSVKESSESAKRAIADAEAAFEKQLKIKLRNEADRRGWAYMGMDEVGSDSERLHFHFLMYIPEDSMVGELYETRDWCGKTFRWVKRIENSYFFDRFGMNKFEKITAESTLQPAHYISKYMSKTDGKMIYSRHLPSYVIKDLPDVADNINADMIGRIEIDYPANRETGEIKKRGFIISDVHLPKNIPGRFGKITEAPKITNTTRLGQSKWQF
ncbi:MAG: hypothetical protein FWB72_03940 [Firmicutes bacterium]|nr:hypothetical protein [Bacillota bacterium]